jgi:antitoxin ParD1/3/4
MPSSYAIGERFERFIKRQVEAGRYASASEVVRDALRLLEEHESEREAALEVLREEIRVGLASGPAMDADEVFDRLEGKYQAMIDEQGA